ncbi:motility protein A [Hydrocarboniclastica marina]|uniref:Flagellar motor protein PomA n=1 Tax=Hydrocarboniclastica marina TaxID=2259620 RepID=A0A4P7XLD2_9ALTE|nr:MotA/TolQ/ExbB proton channel family protein [Hydrocarboniclastica marina]MAM00479.1 flagellar motor protein PomA [Alteromonadaceae bacterium]QCF27735.1 flagellar motor protein PomA [Hydrocarboniclastica marina]
MDILTLVGLIAGVSVVALAILAGSDLGAFMNLPGLAIVVFGTFSVTLIKYRLHSVKEAFALAVRTAFTDRTVSPVVLVGQVRELANLVRKEGILGLEDYQTDEPYLRKAINLAVDGHPPEFIDEALLQEMQQTLERYDVAERVFRGIGDSAPALGMLGTLVGLVQMLNNMADPGSIGPAMAVALLTTFYGALIAQLVALPLADKLQLKAVEAQRNMMVVHVSMLNIMKGQNPRLMTELLSAYLTPEQRGKLQPEANR